MRAPVKCTRAASQCPRNVHVHPQPPRGLPNFCGGEGGDWHANATFALDMVARVSERIPLQPRHDNNALPPCNCNPFDIRRQAVAIGCLGSRPSDQPHAEPTAQTTAAHYDAAVARYRRKQRCTRDLTNVCVMACDVAIAIAGLLHAALRSLATQCAPSRCPPDASAHDVATYARGRAARATVRSRVSRESCTKSRLQANS